MCSVPKFFTFDFFQPTHMASFHQVQSLQTVQSEYESGCKAILQLKIAGASEVFSVFVFKYSF